MPWKQSSMEVNKSGYMQQDWSSKREILDIRRMMQNKGEKNFTVQLLGGTLRTERGILSSGFSAKVKLDNQQSQALIEHLLSSQNNWREDRYHSCEEQTLHLTTSTEVNNKKVNYLVDIKPIEAWVNIVGRDEKRTEFVLSPVLPKEIAKAMKGIHLDGVKGIEGIDPEMNTTALTWARTMHKVFGLPYTKLDEKCVKTVCIKPEQVDDDRILTILQDPTVTINLKKSHMDYHNVAEGTVIVSYRKNSLGIDGFFYGKVPNSNAAKAIGAAERALFAANVSVDTTKSISFEAHYHSEISNSIGSGLESFFGKIGGAIHDAVRKPFKIHNERQEERDKKIRRGLKETGALQNLEKPLSTPEGGVCVIMYDPQCFLKNEKRADTTATQADKNKTTNK